MTVKQDELNKWLSRSENGVDIRSKLLSAKEEVGDEEYNERLQFVYDRPVLNYADTFVVNLPGPCGANCVYCIDKMQGFNSNIDYQKWLNKFKQVLSEFKLTPFKRITITGGTLPPEYFNQMMAIIRDHYRWSNLKKPIINWNTNGYRVNGLYDISYINYVNLHRQAKNDDKNKALFRFKEDPITLSNAKLLFQNKLYISMVVTKDFNLDECWFMFTNVNLRRQMPSTKETDEKFAEVEEKLKITFKKGLSYSPRRNRYVNYIQDNKYTDKKNIIAQQTVRLSYGDPEQNHIPGRYPVFLNVVILHRNGRVCGSWFEDDKVLDNQKI